MNRKLRFWSILITGLIAVGFGVTAFCLYRIQSQEIQPPAEICLSNKFPGKSVSVEALDSNDRSVFDDNKFASELDDKFYSAFQEERFDKDKFKDEIAFSEIAKADEIYRFSWNRTFHNPYLFRAYRMGDAKFLVIKETSGRGGYDPGTLILNNVRKLSDAEWCEFIVLLDRADFWNKKKIEVSKLANDGALWSIEGVRQKRYYVTGEQSPRTGEFRDACLYLMRISGANIDEKAWEFY